MRWQKGKKAWIDTAPSSLVYRPAAACSSAPEIESAVSVFVSSKSGFTFTTGDANAPQLLWPIEFMEYRPTLIRKKSG